jgi:hypothetical protein
VNGIWIWSSLQFALYEGSGSQTGRTTTSRPIRLDEIWGSHSNDADVDVGCKVVWTFSFIPTFRRNILPLFLRSLALNFYLPSGSHMAYWKYHVQRHTGINVLFCCLTNCSSSSALLMAVSKYRVSPKKHIQTLNAYNSHVNNDGILYLMAVSK